MKSLYKILIADDEQSVCTLLEELLSDMYDVSCVSRGDRVLDLLVTDTFSILILDLHLPGMNGLDILKKIHEDGITVAVVVLTGSNDVQTAITAMKLGAYDYIVKPFDNERLLIVLKNIEDKLKLESELNDLRVEMGKNLRFKSMIGSSPVMQGIYRTLEKVIDTDSTILITGESGTGKGVLARSIHYNSSRRDRPFRALDCSTIPRELIASELFGHEKGSFTGAHSRKIGKFEAVEDGTLFLDEIGNLSFDIQSKLLRVMQDREFERIGGNQLISVEARIIAATNSDLKEMVQKGEFREDLYYRLNVLPIQLPGLRHRQEDIPLFIDYFLDKNNREYDRDVAINMDARILLTEYPWPGNIRQLENVIRRLVLLSDSRIVGAADVEKIVQLEEPAGRISIAGSAGPAIGAVRLLDSGGGIRPFEDVERDVIRKVLEYTGYNISRAAKELGVSRKTLHNKINRYALTIQKVAGS
ncbi:MAG: sigma-54-dependent transcriptional regulator [Spirochaetota bacterium]